MKGFNIVFNTSALCPRAGENRQLPPLGVGDDIVDQKRNRPPDAGDDRDVPHGSLSDADRALLARNKALHTAEVDAEVMLAVAENRARLEYFAAFHRLP